MTYLQALADPEILKKVERLMSVSISRFFRDRSLWRILEEEIIPDHHQPDTVKRSMHGRRVARWDRKPTAWQ